MTIALKTLRALLWTGGLAALFLFIDRAVYGPATAPGWRASQALSDLSRQSSAPLPPPYLPNALVWPPARILIREQPEPGWWIGLQSREKGESQLWIGRGASPLPAELENFAPCMNDGHQPQCPADWRFFSTRIRGATILLFSRLAPEETKRILTGLELPP